MNPSNSSLAHTVPDLTRTVHDSAQLGRSRRHRHHTTANLMALFDQIDARVQLPFMAVGRNDDARAIRCFITRRARVDVIQQGDVLVAEDDPSQVLLQDGQFDSAALCALLGLQLSREARFDLALNLCGYHRQDPQHAPLTASHAPHGTPKALNVCRWPGTAHSRTPIIGTAPSAGAYLSVEGTAGTPVTLLTTRNPFPAATSSTGEAALFRRCLDTAWLSLLPPLRTDRP